MAWQFVESSWLQAIDYRPEEMALYVRFHKGGVPTITARYSNVDPSTGHALMNASSKGQYFHKSGLIRRPYTIVAGK